MVHCNKFFFSLHKRSVHTPNCMNKRGFLLLQLSDKKAIEIRVFNKLNWI